jgi:hypothetical protein
MSIKELKEILAKHPDHMEVFMAERKTEFTYGMVNSAEVKEIAFSESPGDEILATDHVLIL